MPGTPKVPLARLFAMAFRASMDELHTRLRARGYDDVRPNFGYVLLAARGDGTTAKDVATLMGVSKQAAAKLVDAMVSAGYLDRFEHAEDARSVLLKLTPRGRRLLSVVERIYEDTELEWARVIGANGVETLRRDITRVLRAGHGGALPPVRPVESD